MGKVISQICYRALTMFRAIVRTLWKAAEFKMEFWTELHSEVIGFEDVWWIFHSSRSLAISAIAAARDHVLNMATACKDITPLSYHLRSHNYNVTSSTEGKNLTCQSVVYVSKPCSDLYYAVELSRIFQARFKWSKKNVSKSMNTHKFCKVDFSQNIVFEINVLHKVPVKYRRR